MLPKNKWYAEDKIICKTITWEYPLCLSLKDHSEEKNNSVIVFQWPDSSYTWMPHRSAKTWVWTPCSPLQRTCYQHLPSTELCKHNLFLENGAEVNCLFMINQGYLICQLHAQFSLEASPGSYFSDQILTLMLVLMKEKNNIYSW